MESNECYLPGAGSGLPAAGEAADRARDAPLAVNERAAAVRATNGAKQGEPQLSAVTSEHGHSPSVIRTGVLILEERLFCCQEWGWQFLGESQYPHPIATYIQRVTCICCRALIVAPMMLA